jgi:hypothetical protein
LLIEEKPATDDTLDRTAAANALLARLKTIEHFHAAAERNAASDLALYYSLLSWTQVHQLTIIDNQTSIVARNKSIKGARDDGKCRSDDKRSRNREMAQEFLSRRGGNLSNSALMAKIGAARKLKRRAAISAVKRGLRDLQRNKSHAKIT